MRRRILTETLNGSIEIEEQRPLPVVPNHALDPEERRDARTARDLGDAVQARRRIQDEVSRRELDRVHAVGVLDEQLAAVVVVRLGEEQRGGQIRPQAMRRAADLTNGVVDVMAERASALVAVEERRE